MQQFQSDARFKILRGRGEGMYADWNECLRLVDTEYFYILTSDDICFQKLVSTTTSTLDSHSEVDMCHFQFATINENGAITATYESILHENVDLYLELSGQAQHRSGLCEFMMHFAYPALYMTITSTSYRSRILTKMDWFSTKFGAAGDIDWTMRACLHTDVIYIPKLLGTWRKYTEQATNQWTWSNLACVQYEIAQSNLALLKATAESFDLRKKIDDRQLLSMLSHFCTVSLCVEILEQLGSGQFSINLLKLSQQLIKRHDYCFLFRQAYRRLSGNRLKERRQRLFANQLIEDYGLQWPPAIIDV